MDQFSSSKPTQSLAPAPPGRTHHCTTLHCARRCPAWTAQYAHCTPQHLPGARKVVPIPTEPGGPRLPSTPRLTNTSSDDKLNIWRGLREKQGTGVRGRTAQRVDGYCYREIQAFRRESSCRGMIDCTCDLLPLRAKPPCSIRHVCPTFTRCTAIRTLPYAPCHTH